MDGTPEWWGPESPPRRAPSASPTAHDHRELWRHKGPRGAASSRNRSAERAGSAPFARVAAQPLARKAAAKRPAAAPAGQPKRKRGAPAAAAAAENDPPRSPSHAPQGGTWATMRMRNDGSCPESAWKWTEVASGMHRVHEVGGLESCRPYLLRLRVDPASGPSLYGPATEGRTLCPPDQLPAVRVQCEVADASPVQSISHAAPATSAKHSHPLPIVSLPLSLHLLLPWASQCPPFLPAMQ